MQGDLEILQGEWQIVSLEIDGRSLAHDSFAHATIVVDGDRFVTAGMGGSYAGALLLDESTSPKRLDMNFTAGPHAGQTSPGLYRLEGDEWTICIGFAGYDRPLDFRTSAGSGHALEKLRRQAH